MLLGEIQDELRSSGRRLSELMEEAGDVGLARLMLEVEVGDALRPKCDLEIAELLELALEAVESPALAMLLESASYRLQRARGGATPPLDQPHTFEPYLSTDACWVCGTLADEQVHQVSEVEGGAPVSPPTQELARDASPHVRETPSTSVSSLVANIAKRMEVRRG